MALTPGTRFGTFEVVAPLGAGAMGEVYRARDTKLNRTVALKVLPERLAGDPERLARLKREAQTLASINHPGIAAIYGFEDAGSAHALVLELVEGQTLEERIAHGAIPIDEALPLALQIAAALEAAHEAGIVHRDLKPANIKITPDGAVKLLDFGIAKAVDAETPIGATQSPTLAPTFTPTQAIGSTAAGTIMGTATYMAPEQARGQAVDRRADIWAFGCVLFEMLAGRRAFDGDNISDVIAAILRSEPDWTALPASTPTAIRRLLRRCLEKERRERLQAIGDARIEIAETMHSVDDAPGVANAAAPMVSTKAFPWIPVVAIASTLIAGGAVWLLTPSSAVAPAAATRSLLGILPWDQRTPLPPGQGRVPILRRDRPSLALTPDGRTLIIRALADGDEQLFTRPLDSLAVTPLAGSEGADTPFISPRGDAIGFRVGNELKRVPIGGGIASTIARIPGSGPAPRIYGASWGDGDVVVFATEEGTWQVAAGGGAPRLISKPAETEYRHTLPHLLPGGRTFLFTITTAGFRWDDAKVVALGLEGGTAKVVLENAAHPQYDGNGQLLFMRAGALMAVPFDPSSLRVTGNPVALVRDVMQAINTGNTNNDTGSAQFAVAANGTLVYGTGGPNPEAPRALNWLDRTGAVTPLDLPERLYGAPRLSPDGTRVAVSIGPDSQRRVWVTELARGALTAVTGPQELAFYNIWSPDGTRFAYLGLDGLDVRTADGGGQPRRVYAGRPAAQPSSWSPDGTLLATVERHPTTAEDIWIHDVSGATPSRRPFLNTAASETFPEFSPDGKWLAYASTDSGRQEVYVQPYPGPGLRVQASIAGAAAPAWGRGGSEIYFVRTTGGTSVVFAATVRTTATGITIDAPHELFQGQLALTSPVRGYDVTSDGSRFLTVRGRQAPPVPMPELVLVQNWTAALPR